MADEPLPKVRAEMRTFSGARSGLIAHIQVSHEGQGAFEFRFYERDGEATMTFAFNNQWLYTGPLWRTEDDLYNALALFTKARLEG